MQRWFRKRLRPPQDRADDAFAVQLHMDYSLLRNKLRGSRISGICETSRSKKFPILCMVFEAICADTNC